MNIRKVPMNEYERSFINHAGFNTIKVLNSLTGFKRIDDFVWRSKHSQITMYQITRRTLGVGYSQEIIIKYFTCQGSLGKIWKQHKNFEEFLDSTSERDQEQLLFHLDVFS